MISRTMSRKLIDRDALIASIPKTNVDIFENCRNCSTLCDWQVKELIDKMPTIDAVEVVHGEWEIDEYGIYHCPICHAINNTVYKNFCPNCGAKMDGKENENEQH